MKLNYKRTFIVGFAFFAITAFWNLYDHTVPLILQNTFNLKNSQSGMVMAADNLVALLLIPLFGALSDKTQTKLGRRKPYIMLGSVGAIIFMLLIPTADRMASLPFFLVSLAFVLLFMGSFRSPAVALMPDVTIPPLRSQANAIINLMGALGGVCILLAIKFLLPKKEEGVPYQPSYFPVFILCALLMLLATIVVFFLVKENKFVEEMHAEADKFGINLNKDDETEKTAKTGNNKMSPKVLRSFLFLISSIVLWFFGYNAVISSFSKYCIAVFNLGAGESATILLIANVSAIVSYYPIAIISSKIGRKKTILAGIFMLAAAFTIGASIREFSPFLNVAFVLAGVGWASINVNSFPMVASMAPEGNVGKYTGYYYFASMSAQILTPIFSGFLIDTFNYHILFPYGSVFVALSFITMLAVKHGDERPTPAKNKLEALNSMDT